MEEEKQEVANEMGTIRITDEVVAIIAGIAAMEAKGVVSMSGGFAGGISEMLGRKNLSKGVRVEVGEKNAKIDLYLTVEYGCRIPEVAWDIQERVKNSVETMTGLIVPEVNIHIQGVSFDKENEQNEEEEDEQDKDEQT